ncbi:hypothetical protein TWF506_006795 [Arthrobotrys conoides]|uniref:Uncharacterized protein n=1 Tax=Arthrobotrys conoides TaxID=74498 RepID=A0AAN8NHG2_9PEZI
MPNNTQNQSEFLRRVSTSARKREFEYAISQWEQSVADDYDEVAVNIEHREQDVFGGITNEDDEDEPSVEDSGELAVDIRTPDGKSLRRRRMVDGDYRSPKRKKEEYDDAHNATATTSLPPPLANTNQNPDSPDQGHPLSSPRVIKDVTSTPQREQALFLYGKDELPKGEATGIFSPRITITPNNQDIPSPVLLKERHVYIPNKRRLTDTSDAQGSGSEVDELDGAMPFKIFGWSPSRKSASVPSTADSTPQTSKKRSIGASTHPQGIRLTTFSARLKALRIENINKKFIKQNSDSDINADQITTSLAQDNQDSTTKPDNEWFQSEAMALPTSESGNISSSMIESTSAESDEPSILSNLPASSLEPVNTKAEVCEADKTSETDRVSEESSLNLIIDFADAYATDLGVVEDEQPSGTSPISPEHTDTPDSPLQRLQNYGANRRIPLLDEHDLARAEEMAARAVIAKYLPPTEKIGNFSFGGQPQAKEKEAKLKSLRQSFGRYVNDLDITKLEKNHTVTAWKRNWNEHLAGSGATPIAINRKQDVEACFHKLIESEGDFDDESANEFLRLMNRDEISVEQVMAQVNEKEFISKQRRQQQQGQNEAESTRQQDEDTDSTPNRPWPRLPCTPGWKPVEKGWVSHDGRYECVEAGVIPKFAFREQQDEPEAPDVPKTIWSGATGSDDEHINEDISFKLLGLEDNWKASPTGMYMSGIDDDLDYDSDESEIGWSSRLLNHRLLLTCNSVNGSNVDLSYDPEELDIPTMDTNRHFAKMDCTLANQYPNYVKTERKFNRMGEMVIIPPPVRKDKIPRKSCMKPLNQLRRARRGRPVARIEKWAKFKLMPEERDATDKLHPRPNGWSQKKQYILRKAFRQRGLYEMLPSVRAQHTRIRGFEQYYPRFLQQPAGTQVRQTASYGAAYILNHIARFKLGLPTEEDGKTRVKIRNALKKIIEHRKNGQTRYQQNTLAGYQYKIFSRAHQRRRIRQVDQVLPQDVNLVGTFQTRVRPQGAYMVYWRTSKKRNTDEQEDGDWVDLTNEGHLNEEPAGG